MIDISDARELADRALHLVDTGEAQRERAAALLMNAGMMLFAGDFPAADVVARGMAWCRRKSLCPCKMVLTGQPQQHSIGQTVGMEDLAPAWLCAAQVEIG
ncbi:MAG: hypothetical protein IPK79_01185 [Vampirovibrionales bacterium]|nr:hypothetical protein [Vampirovibrionales bacterium]